jgi:DNA polymerase V
MFPLPAIEITCARRFGRAYAGPLLPLPFFGARVPAGFPSPADDYIEGEMDLNELLIHHPAATFFVRAEGDSMEGAGIHSGDILVVDRSLEAGEGDIVIAALDGELTVKRLRRQGERLFLAPENRAWQPIEITPENDFQVWGVVSSVIRQM